MAGYYDLIRPEVQSMVPYGARRILDVGCASGAVGAALKRRQPCSITGVEMVPEVAERAKENLDYVIAGDIEDDRVLDSIPAGYFDCILCSDVIEHLRNPGRVLKRLNGCLTPNGCLVASVPNVRHWTVLKDLLEGRWDYQDAGILDRTHLRFFTRSSLTRMLEEQDFLVTDICGVPVRGVEDAPAGLAEALQKFGIDAHGLEKEGKIYQYLLTASPVRRRKTSYTAPRSAAARAPDDPPVASLVMLALNQMEYTQECILSLFEHTPIPHELIVVDNGSTDGTPDFLKRLSARWPHVKVISNTSNLGFAGGNNQGMAAARGEVVVLLNNDLLFTPNWLEKMLAWMQEDPSVGLVGPCSNHGNGCLEVSGGYSNMEELARFAAEFEGRHDRKGFAVKRLVGFCLAIRRAVIDAIGGLDEGFGIGNFEDNDYCLRARAAGFTCRIAADTFIHHVGSQTFNGEKIDHGYWMDFGWSHFKKKWNLNTTHTYNLPYEVDVSSVSRDKLYFPLPEPQAVRI